jgi:acetyltransferase-like isoleucine patch superfamily enzyme
MTKRQRLLWSAIIMLIPGANRKTAFIRKHHLYGHVGKNCIIQKGKLPLYSNLVFLHDNVMVASNVGFVTHDITHRLLNTDSEEQFVERVGCIEIMDNVFVGAGTRILYDTRIGSNVIIGAGSLVNKDIPDNSVYAGVPARYICSFKEFVEKHRRYSDNFRETYGVDMLSGVSDDLAQKMYKNFCESRVEAVKHESDAFI